MALNNDDKTNLGTVISRHLFLEELDQEQKEILGSLATNTESRPDTISAHFRLGQILKELGRPQESQWHHEISLCMKKEDEVGNTPRNYFGTIAWSLRALGKLYAEQSDYQKALAYLKEAEEGFYLSGPLSSAYQKEVATLIENTRKKLEQSTEDGAEQVVVPMLLGFGIPDNLHDKNYLTRWNAHVQLQWQRIELCVDNLLRLGLYQEALVVAEQWSRLALDGSWSLDQFLKSNRLLGELFRRAGNLEEAERRYWAALRFAKEMKGEKDPLVGELWIRLADVCDREDAIHAYEEAIDVFMENPRTMARCVGLLTSAGCLCYEPDSSIGYWEHALHLAKKCGALLSRDVLDLLLLLAEIDSEEEASRIYEVACLLVTYLFPVDTDAYDAFLQEISPQKGVKAYYDPLYVVLRAKAHEKMDPPDPEGLASEILKLIDEIAPEQETE